MRLSAESKYAMRAMFDIAYHDDGGPTKAERIAHREEIPGKFLEQILRKLKAAELVASRRGPKGGYSLKLDPKEITVGAIIRATEGTTDHACYYDTDESALENCDLTSRCVTATTWRDLADSINHLLESVTVADMIARAERFGVPRAGYSEFSYVI